tara:strand:- start:1772 stop:2107 length:336 start_codon:yes stop_codon:yes gene_type:complete
MNNRPEYASTNEKSEIEFMEVGDKVISFDMEFKPFSWVRGTVVALEEIEGCLRCVIEVEAAESCRDEDGFHDHVVDTRKYKKGERLSYPPQNGTRLVGGTNKYTQFVQKVA